MTTSDKQNEGSDNGPSASSLIDFIEENAPVFVLTGAGISTASGLGAYRDDNGDWIRQSPITGQDFKSKLASRQRYWARSYVGWPSVADALPNVSHNALVTLQEQGLLSTLVTQNVDGLHTLAGINDVTDLHGNLHTVKCLSCGQHIARHEFQDTLEIANPVLKMFAGKNTADGDSNVQWQPQGQSNAPYQENFPADAAQITDELIANLILPDCDKCGGMLKPDVVFFGENVDRGIVEATYAALQQSGSTLIIGSSLMIYSGFRFARRTSELGLPLAILNKGKTRADEIATLKVASDCSIVLEQVARHFSRTTN